VEQPACREVEQLAGDVRTGEIEVIVALPGGERLMQLTGLGIDEVGRERSGVAAGIGGGGRGFESRVDAFSRFSPDPFRESRWAPYAGAGISGRLVRNDTPRAHAYLLVFLGVEGPLPGTAASGWVPAFELGVGGGVRAAVVLRRGVSRRR